MQPTPEYELDTPEPKVNRTALLIGLGVLTVMAASLLVLRSSLKSAGQSPPEQSGMTDDWQSSLQHLHDAIQYRFSGLDDRLDRLERDVYPVTPNEVTIPLDLPEPRSANEPEPLPAPAPAHVSVPE